MRFRTVLALALMLTAPLAGCATPDSGDGVASANGGTPTTSASAAPSGDADRDAPVKFAQCMREHGMTWFKDPEPGSRGLQIRVPAGQDKDKVDAAMAACQKFMPNGGPPDKVDPQMLEKMRQMSQCMRDHGITDFPDPNPNGSMQLDGDKLGTGPGQPKFDAAEKACSQYLPKPDSNGDGGVQKGSVAG